MKKRNRELEYIRNRTKGFNLNFKDVKREVEILEERLNNKTKSKNRKQS